MDENIVDDLLNRISKLSSDLESKDSIISQLRSEIQQLKQEKLDSGFTSDPAPTKKKSKWNLLANATKVKSFMSKSIKFCHSNQGDLSKIEFPVSLSNQSSDISVLTRGISTNSLISHLLAEIKSIDKKKTEIDEEVSRKKADIMDHAQKTAETMESFYAPSLNSLKEKTIAALKTIKAEIETSFILENDTQRVFLVENIDENNLQVGILLLKDKNGIALKEPSRVKKSIIELENFKAILRSETDSIMSTLNSHKITVFYQIIEIENNEKICCPVNITPHGISLQDYEIKFNNSQQEITEIVNKADGAVQFSTILVSEDCGLVHDSVIEIFSSEISSHILNVLHFHIEDMKTEIPIEAIYILSSQTPAEYEDWTKDAFGRELRYKLIVKNGKIEAVLYNTGSTTEYIHFIERRIQIGDWFKFEDFVIEIIGLPTGLLTRDWEGKEIEFPIEFVKHQSISSCLNRHASDLPGLIDVKVIIHQGEVFTGTKEFAVPICQIEEISQKEKNDIKEVFNTFENKKIENLSEKITKIEALVTSYNLQEVKDKKAYLNELSGIVSSAKDFMSNNEDLRNKHYQIIQQAERVMRNVAIDIRFNP